MTADKRIIKVSLNVNATLQYSLPKGAKFLSCHPQRDEPCLWFLADYEDPGRVCSLEYELRVFSTYMTGHRFLAKRREFLGTVLMHDGTFVIHVFEELERL
jgi:hypothetical protein